MGFDHGLRSIRIVQRFQIRFDDVERARSFAVRTGVHQNGGFVAVLQRVSQVEAANAKIGHAHALRQLPVGQAANHFDAKRVIAEKDVADAGDQDGRLLRRRGFARASSGESGSTSSASKKKR